jgi:hypothetical protein
VDSFDGDFNQSFNEDLSVVFLPDLQIFALLWVKKILNLVKINLVKTDVDVPFQHIALLPLVMELLQNVIDRLGNDAVALCANVA